MEKQRYISPYTDFGFKYIFGSELNKEYLISFLNALFNGRHVIKDVTYHNTEHLDGGLYSRRAIFDVYCTTDKGDYIIVEMQNVDQDYFLDRMVYYSTFPIREQAKRGDWDFNLSHVYTIGILNFVFNNDNDEPHHEAKLIDVATHEVFFDKLTYITIELPKFNKDHTQLVTLYDKWLFVLRNLSKLMKKPPELQEKVFSSLFRHAEIDRMKPEKRMEYDKAMTAYNDINNSNKKKYREGMVKGKAEGHKEEKLDIARNMKQKGMDTKTIADITGLTAKEIKNL